MSLVLAAAGFQRLLQGKDTLGPLRFTVGLLGVVIGSSEIRLCQRYGPVRSTRRCEIHTVSASGGLDDECSLWAAPAFFEAVEIQRLGRITLKRPERN